MEVSTEKHTSANFQVLCLGMCVVVFLWGGDFYLVFHCCGQHVNFEGMLSGSYPLGLIG